MKYLRLCFLLKIIPVLALLVSGCSGFYPVPDDTGDHLRIVIGQGSEFARTSFPDFSSLDTDEGKFVLYVVEITGGGETFTISSGSPDFLLNPSTIEASYPYGGLIYGTYTFSVKAYRAGESDDKYSAFGTKQITLGPGVNTVTISIGPVIETGATGTLSYKITGTGSAVLLSYSDFLPEPADDPEILPGSAFLSVTLNVDGKSHTLVLQSGYYVIKYTDSKGIDNIDVVNIFKNFTTELSLEL